ncbi:probable RNA polymerase II nuclear localization protein SLC7A6OS [Tachysurus fulvidraco]|uniref:probable RNA polymerase II nuclear localization protein SLC7A6OS n=1 Tax=Tachysurus fulvidraco TaxID=1234273 RepID=UPI000F4D3222|nr:probable RNA polymerase II nuclear localization protein SLC7A6OS [Tachysurus fulvidraco]XP_047666422.1 probable RNA polymerase II nuclear localization protein SLC7A6OS [Tachysurus fulvidraco]
MDPGTTILRVKRKRCTDPADALLLACKRVRAESSPVQSEPEPERIENSVFKLVATVSSQDTPVQTHVREALSRPRLAHALRPSHGSSTRVISDLRNTKWTTRREERYRILSSHRAGLPAEPRIEHEPEEKVQTDTGSRLGDVQVFDIVQEDGEEHEKEPEKNMQSDSETILCNSVKMMREKLSMSTHGVGTEHREKEDDYVYDLYYQEKATPGWIQDILSVRPYTEEGELVPDEVAWEEEVYEDEDDENAESNWRNDYPDEDSEDENNEERYGGCWSEEHSYSRRSWERYQREVMKELEEDEDGEEFDSD